MWSEEEKARVAHLNMVWRSTEVGKRKCRSSEQRRRARKAAAEGSFTAEDIKDLYVTQGAKCYYCSVSIEEEYHIDHMTPLIRGGSNDVSNLCLTDPECNLRKHTKTAEEFQNG